MEPGSEWLAAPRALAAGFDREGMKVDKDLISFHCTTRMQQRGMRPGDLQLVMEHGTEIGLGRIMLTSSDAEHAIAELRKQIELCSDQGESARLGSRLRAFDRLRNRVVVVEDGVFVTAYHNDAKTPRAVGKQVRRRRAQRRKATRRARRPFAYR